MMVTALPLPSRYRRLLKSCAMPICDRLQRMTLAEASRFCVDHSRSPSACLWVTVTRGDNGKIEDLSAQLVPAVQYVLKSGVARPHLQGFWSTVPVLGGPYYCSRKIATGLFDLLIRDEVEKRYRNGPRELGALPEDDLLALDAALRARTSYRPETGGAQLSEDFLAALVARELGVRASESAHSRLACLHAQRKKLSAAAKALEKERVRAAGIGTHRMSGPGIRENLSDVDQTLLMARDDGLAAFWHRF